MLLAAANEAWKRLRVPACLHGPPPCVSYIPGHLLHPKPLPSADSGFFPGYHEGWAALRLTLCISLITSHENWQSLAWKLVSWDHGQRDEACPVVQACPQ